MRTPRTTLAALIASLALSLLAGGALAGDNAITRSLPRDADVLVKMLAEDQRPEYRLSCVLVLWEMADDTHKELAGKERRDVPADELTAALVPLAEKAVPALTAVLSESDTKLVFAAQYALAEFSHHAAAASDALKANLQHEDPSVRWSACIAFGGMGKAGAGAMDALQAALDDDSEHVRQYATVAIAKVGEPEAVEPVAVRMLRDSAARVRYAAAFAFMEHAPAMADGLPALVGAMKRERDTQVIIAAARAFAEHGEEAAAAVPVLARHLDNPSARPEVLATLVTIATPAAHQLVLDVANRSDLRPIDQRALMQCFAVMGTDAAAAKDRLLAWLDTGERALATPAAEALAHVDPDGDVGVPALIARLFDGETEVRRAAMIGLQTYGPKAAPARPYLVFCRQDPVPNLRLNALQALQAIDMQDGTQQSAR